MKLGSSFRYGLFINLWLMLMVLGTALLLVRWQYNSRNLFVALERAKSTGKELAAINASTLAEKRQLSAPVRVEHLAAQHLGMKTADPAVTVYLKP
ncbi:MAG: cell division protein FtsL [Cytophagales bacterium]|nr:cell division protein FtsL [Cytophagales bacterium]